MSFDADGFLIIGHRGASGSEPENTLRSFRRAFELGVDAIELDVQRADGRLVVIHDDSVDRTTNGVGPVSSLGSEALRALDAGHGERIPFLEEVLDILPPNVGINVELKGPGTAESLVPVLRGRGADVLVSSFAHDELKTLMEQDAKFRRAPLFGRRTERMLEIATSLEAWSINVADRWADESRVGRIRDAGFRCLVYTVNDADRGADLRRWGVSGIFTDYPERF